MKVDKNGFSRAATLSSSGLKRVKRSLKRRLSELVLQLYVLKYRAQDRFEVKIQDRPVWFSIEDPYSKSWILQRCASGKIHEKPITLFLLELLKNAQCFVDCGANLGWYTCLASKHMPDGIVYAFEMDDLNYDLLQKNVNINNYQNVIINHAAVTDTPGKVSYRRALMGPNPMNSLASNGQHTEASAQVTVEAISLDDFFKDKAVKPDVMKIDVEGAETKVLRGMQEIMQHAMPELLVEVHPNNLRKMQSSEQEVLSILLENGYEVFLIEEIRKQRDKINTRKLEQNSPLPATAGQIMFYAYHKDKQKLHPTSTGADLSISLKS